MVSVSKCPRCQQLVAIPEGVDLDAAVQCPLCSEEYPLRESLPPALIPVGLPESSSTPGSGNGVVSAADAAIAVEELDRPDVSEVLEPEPDDSVAEAAGSTVEQAADASEQPRQPGDPDPAADETSDAGMFDFLHNVKPSEEVNAGTSHVGARTESDVSGDLGAGRVMSSIGERPRRKEKSILKEMVGALIGGFVGLLIGYYGLNYFGGERFDFLGIWLPGVGHTMKHWTGVSDADPEPQPQPDPAEVYPPDPRPDGAVNRAVSRYLDMHMERLISTGRIRPDSSEDLVPVRIADQDYSTLPEGAVIQAVDEVQIGGAALEKGRRLRRQDQWWIELSEPESEEKPQTPPDAKPDTKPGLEPTEPQPEIEPEPEAKSDLEAELEVKPDPDFEPDPDLEPDMDLNLDLDLE